MAIALESSTPFTALNDLSPVSFSHTVSSGDDRLLVVCTAYRDASGNGATSVTWGGTALTELGSVYFAGGHDPIVQIWYLVAPSSGTNTVEITFSTAKDDTDAIALDFTGVDQASPWGTVATNSGAATNPTITVDVSSAAGELVVDNAAGRDSLTFTVGAGQTEHANQNPGDQLQQGVSTEPGAATTTMSWSTSGDFSRWVTIAAPIKPAAEGTTLTPSTGSASIALYAPLASTTVGLAPAATTLAYGASSPTVSVPEFARPPPAALTWTGQTPAPATAQNLTPGTTRLQYASTTPTLSDADALTPSPDAATYGAATPTVTDGDALTSVTARLTVARSTPQVSAPALLTPPTTALTLDAQTLVLGDADAVTSGTGMLAYAGVAPTITGPGAPVTVAPAVGALTYALQPTTADDSHTQAPTVASVTYAGGAAPTVADGDAVTPPTATVSYAATTPLVGDANLLGPTPTTLAYAQFTPLVEAGDNRIRRPATATLAYQGVAGAVGDADALALGANALAYTSYAPSSVETSNVIVGPGAGTLTYAASSPVAGQAVRPAPADVAYAGGTAPGIVDADSVTVPTGPVVYTGQAPTRSIESARYYYWFPLRARLETVSQLKSSPLRAYPVKLPQVPRYPAVVYRLLSAEREHAMTRATGDVHARIQIDVYAERFVEATDIAKSVRDSLERFRGEAGGVIIQDVFVDGEDCTFQDKQEDARERVWRRSLEITMHFRE